MGRRKLLLLSAVIASVGCGGKAESSFGASDAGRGEVDARAAAEASGGCDACAVCRTTTTSTTATSAQACSVALDLARNPGQLSGSDACLEICEAAEGGSAGEACAVAPSYVVAYTAAVAEAGTDEAADAGLVCPAWAGGVPVECTSQCPL